MDILRQSDSCELSISVIVPAYNSCQSLDKCVSSIVDSIDDNSEVLIINDGSTDETLNKAKDLSHYYRSVRVISQVNQGVSGARNTGIRHARGRYVAFVDSDDWIDAPYSIFNSLRENAVRTDADVVIAGYTASRVEDSLRLDNRIYRRNFDKEFESLILLRSIGKPYGKLIKRDFLLANGIFFPVGMRHQEDAVFLYKMLTHASTVATITDCTYHYVLPECGKVYSSKLEDELRGYDEMCHAVDSLIDSMGIISNQVRARLELRKSNMACHVYDAIQREPIRRKRIEAYRHVKWDAVIPMLGIHQVKKWLLYGRMFEIADRISNRPHIL